MSELSSAKKFQFVGGDLALDFCNTVGGKRGSVTREHLVSYLEFAAWSFQAGLLTRPQAEACLERAKKKPAEAADALARAIDLREALFRIFAARIEKKAPSRADLVLLNSELARSLGRMQLAPPTEGDACCAWCWAPVEGAMDHALGPIAHSAAKLLTNGTHLSRVEICHGDTCGWLFMDSSKNHSRRWCDMRDCGNRAKIRRHRLRQKRQGVQEN